MRGVHRAALEALAQEADQLRTSSFPYARRVPYRVLDPSLNPG
jgi:hypothetical protein